MYDSDGNKTWEAQLDIYGRVRTFAGRSLNECPFRYQGQYQDSETGLYYNRFRYFDPSTGNYISQDLIGLMGGKNLYGYVPNPTTWVDILGLSGFLFRGDNTYKGGDVGLPLGSQADVMTPWEHVKMGDNPSGKTSIFTSFSESKQIANDFGKTSKVSMADLKALEAEGKIKIHTPESVAEMMRNSGNKKLMREANNVKQIMSNNKEVLIEGMIDKKHIKSCH